MTRRDDTIRLRHMLDYAHSVRRLAEGCQRADLEHDEKLRLALVRAVEVNGEAAVRVTESMQQSHPDIPWRQIIGTRHRLIHGYDQVDLDLLWRIATDDMPPLIDQLTAILNAESG
ncbi:MAG: DUF86 domain-containing protein [Phycisphaeraceae bacterium]|nr:DUF86 domain-containing protein [Phycisphaeraceae bacterium]